MYKEKNSERTPLYNIKENSTSNPPLSLTATSGDIEGEIDLVWEPVKNAKTYVIQKSSDPHKPKRWKIEDIITKSSYTVSKLKSRRKYWFRVAAVGSKGQGAWSNPVQKKSP